MIKHIVLILNLLGILTFKSIFTSEVILRTNIPSEVDAGGSFTAEIIINKGDLDKFARFKMDLPAGFKATAKSTANGEFSFKDQSVVFFWIKLPYEEEFSISFDIEVASAASGEFIFEGTFSYIEDNSRETINMVPQKIIVKTGEYAAAAKDDESITFSYGNITERGISCIRQKPYLSDNDEIIINLLVNKGSISKFGKITETVPIGYTAQSVKGKNANFTFSNHNVKFAWLDLPANEQFVVTYKLIAEADVSNQAFILTGTFSYIGNEQLREVEIVQRDIDLDAFQPEGLVAEATDIVQPTDQIEEPVAEPTEIIETKADDQVVVVEKIEPDEVEEPVIEIVDETELAVKTEPETRTTEDIKDDKVTEVITKYVESDYEPAIVSIPEPETGIGYKVQVAAGHKLVRPEYFKKLNIYDEVRVEIHEGWHKYTVGNYRIYKDARDYRIHLWNTTPVNDAFVAAYNYGTRITVQEALMIASQKWYK